MKNEKKQERHSPLHIYKNVAFMFRYTAKYAPGYIWVTLIEAIGRACDHIFVSVWYVKYLFDAIEAKTDYKNILMVTLLAAGYLLCFELFNKWMLNVFRPKANLKIHEGMQRELYEKALSLDQSCYDDPAFYNDFVWAMRESDSRTVQMMVDLSIFLNRIIATVAIFGLLAYMDWIVSLIVAASTVTSFLLQLACNKTNLKRSEAVNQIDRKMSYVRRVFYLTDHAKELRQGDAVSRLKAVYRESTAEKIGAYKKFRKLYWLTLIQMLARGILFDAGVTGYLVVRYALDPALSLGSFSASINATWKLNWQLYEIVQYLGKFNEHSIYVDKFRRFLGYEAKIKGGTTPVGAFETLTLERVSFAYPAKADGSEPAKQVLSDVSLSIRRGDNIALVGYNGAGKTTLIKLLMRLYDPTGGRILYNGTDIKELDLAQYRAHIGAVFQDYHIFAATLGENVMGGEMTEDDRGAVTAALAASSFTDKLSALEMGLDTPLTREFDDAGTGLSGGESQKVAIARVFARPYDLCIMDEPSSALDPVAEYNLNHSILAYAADKTVVFISHRLSTTRMADCIYTFRDGEIVEQGNHDALMAQNGIYAEMFRVQAEKYRSQESSDEN